MLSGNTLHCENGIKSVQHISLCGKRFTERERGRWREPKSYQSVINVLVDQKSVGYWLFMLAYQKSVGY